MKERSNSITGGLPNIKGSTVQILRVLYESLIPTESAHRKADDLLIGLDNQAATTFSTLPNTSLLSSTLSTIDVAIGKLTNDKAKTSIAAEFSRRNAEIQSNIHALNTHLEEKVRPLYKDIKDLHVTIRSLIAKEDSPDKRNQLMQNIDMLKNKTAEFKIVTDEYMKKYNAAQTDQATLRHEVSRNVPISEPAPTPGISPTP